MTKNAGGRTRTVPISEIKNDEANARRRTKDGEKAIRASIERWEQLTWGSARRKPA